MNYFFFFINYSENDITKKDNETNSKKGEKIMCRILNELRGKSADYILQKYHNKKQTIPVDITEIAKNIGIRLGSIDFKSLEETQEFKSLSIKNKIYGAVFAVGEEVQIIYDSNYRELENNNLQKEQMDKKLHNRQRFTIAHEIAHCCLHLKEGESSHIEFRRRVNEPITQKEIEANIFAGELLIPTHIISAMCSALDVLPIAKLADLFDVSYHVMLARLDHLIATEVISAKEYV